MRARDLPKLNAPPLPPPCIWRMKNTHTPISNSMGNQEMNKLVRKEGSSRALPDTCTPDLTSSGTIQRTPGEVRLYGRPASGVTYSVSTAERRGGKEGGSAGRSRRSAYH